MFFSRVKKNYPYYRDAWDLAFLEKTTCDICGKIKKCNTGMSFEQGRHAVCRRCFGKGLATALVPVEISMQVIGPDSREKIEELRRTPPIWWEEKNEWPICCNDFMTYEGDFCDYQIYHPEIKYDVESFRKLTMEDPDHPVENIDQIFDDLEDVYYSYIFSCPHCGKRTVIVQVARDD